RRTALRACRAALRAFADGLGGAHRVGPARCGGVVPAAGCRAAGWGSGGRGTGLRRPATTAVRGERRGTVLHRDAELLLDRVPQMIGGALTGNGPLELRHVGGAGEAEREHPAAGIVGERLGSRGDEPGGPTDGL